MGQLAPLSILSLSVLDTYPIFQKDFSPIIVILPDINMHLSIRRVASLMKQKRGLSSRLLDHYQIGNGSPHARLHYSPDPWTILLTTLSLASSLCLSDSLVCAGVQEYGWRSIVHDLLQWYHLSRFVCPRTNMDCLEGLNDQKSFFLKIYMEI